MHRRNFILGVGASSVGLAYRASASEILLILDGDVNAGRSVSLGDADLLARSQTEFETTTPWTSGLKRFSGPLLSDLLDHYGAGPGDVLLTAANDYRITVERELFTSDAPIVANRINGQPFGRRDLGPLWVVFPYDQARHYRDEHVFAASVWQLSRITVLGG